MRKHHPIWVEKDVMPLLKEYCKKNNCSQCHAVSKLLREALLSSRDNTDNEDDSSRLARALQGLGSAVAKTGAKARLKIG